MGEASQLVQEAVEDVWKRLLLPSLARELRKARTVSAEAHAAGVFGTNLKQVLLAPPLRGTRVLGVDRACGSGCKFAVLDEQGGLLEKGVVFPHTGSREGRDRAMDHLVRTLRRHRAGVVAIGNGTASHETQLFVADGIAQHELLEIEREAQREAPGGGGASTRGHFHHGE